MHQFEIELSAQEARGFDRAFWTFLGAAYAETDEPHVTLRIERLGDRERRTVMFEDAALIETFRRHWAAACGAGG